MGSVQHARLKLVAGLALCAGLLAPSAAQAKTTLVEIASTSPAVINQLEALGLDVTYEGENRTEVMLHGPEDAKILRDSGVASKVLIADMDGANDARLAAEEAHQERVEKGIAPLSTLPTGRVAYRTLADINAELQALAADNPTKVKLFTLSKTSLLGKPIYGVEVSHNVNANVGKPAFLLTGVHHAREWPTPEFTLEFVYDLLMHDNHPTDSDAFNLLEKGKLIAVPVVNPDGYDLSRSLQNEQKRKNCRITSGVIPTLAECTASANVNRGIDLNRNYLPFWGGPGSSTSATASNTRGEAPGSEPEIRGMIDLLNANRSRSRSTTTRPTSVCCARRARPTSRTSSTTRPRTRACWSGSRRTSRAGPPARGPTSTTKHPARPSSRPSTATARSASRPRPRRASAGTRRSTRPTRT